MATNKLSVKAELSKPWLAGVMLGAGYGHIGAIRDQKTGLSFYRTDCSGPTWENFVNMLDRFEEKIIETDPNGCRLGECVAEVSKERLMEAIRRGLLLGHSIKITKFGILLNGIIVRKDEEDILLVEAEFWQRELEEGCCNV
ncbi:MAG: hypothetical protein ACYTEQ_05210 [Planctomycetota bacterium]|jgi:hypothetical protein